MKSDNEIWPEGKDEKNEFLIQFLWDLINKKPQGDTPITPTYGFSYQPAHQNTVLSICKKLSDYLPNNFNIKFIDLGCGTGFVSAFFSDWFKSKSAFDIVKCDGIDLNRNYISFAQTIHAKYKVNFILGDITKYENYINDYNIFYYFRPLLNKHYRKFVLNLLRNVKVDSFIIAYCPYFLYNARYSLETLEKESKTYFNLLKKFDVHQISQNILILKKTHE